MKIAGIMAIGTFPLSMTPLIELCNICDEVYVRFDIENGDPITMKEILKLRHPKIKEVRAYAGWKVPQWREDCLRMLDASKPDIVLTPDEDELFDPTIVEELQQFHASDKRAMMFNYHPLTNRDGKEYDGGVPYPPEPHMKAFKWEPELSYYPWEPGHSAIAVYRNPSLHWTAKTMITHICCWTDKLYQMKRWRSDRPGKRGVKAVTMLGFGPSSNNLRDDSIIGEAWSLNDCYQLWATPLMKRITRIYEMHKFEKREKMTVRDGKQHFYHLNELGKLGHRIIMQKEHHNIVNSEAYPLYDVISVGMDYFMGTPCYMLAQAIMEGYTHIRVFGFDQMDYEHVLQRACWSFWMGIAIGRGIKVDGAMPFITSFNARRYGYDYGPEMDKEMERLLWLGHPMECHYKHESRAVKGDFYGNNIQA